MDDNMTKVVNDTELLVPTVANQDRALNRIRVELTAGRFDEAQESAEGVHLLESQLTSAIYPERLRTLTRAALVTADIFVAQGEYDLAHERLTEAREANQQRPEGVGKQLSAATIKYATGRSFGMQRLWIESRRCFDAALKLSTIPPSSAEAVPTGGNGNSMPNRSLMAVHATAHTALAFTYLPSDVAVAKKELDAAHGEWFAQLMHGRGEQARIVPLPRRDGVFMAPMVGQLANLATIQQRVLYNPGEFRAYGAQLIGELPMASTTFDWPDNPEVTTGLRQPQV